MSALPEYVSDFYRDQPVEIPVLRSSGATTIDIVPIPMQLNEAQLAAKLQEIAEPDNWRLLVEGGLKFEVCGLNGAFSATNELSVVSHVPAIHSSISKAPGNAWEFAVQAALYPEIPQVYIAALGSGGSDGLTSDERKYVRRTGRMTFDEGGRYHALPTIGALSVALKTAGLVMNKLGTDSSGGKLGTALAAELPTGQLTHACFSATPNICDRSGIGLMAGMLTEGLWTGRRGMNRSTDPWKVTADRVAMTKQQLASFYEDIASRLEGDEPSLRDSIGIYLMARKSVGLGPGTRNPLLRDTHALLARHPEAKLTYICGTEDPLCPEAKLLPNMRRFLGDTVLKASDAQAIIAPGLSHGINGQFPLLYQAMKNVALELTAEKQAAK